MDFNTFEQLFVPFCETPDINSGKARSYYLAIRYLAEYLSLQDLDHGNVYRIIEKEEDIKDSSSDFYGKFLNHLRSHRRGSYLSKGYIKAAMPYFRIFATDNNLL